MAYVKCERCGMGWATPMLDGSEPAPHVCPEPFDRKTAETLATMLAASGIPVSQRMKARVRLGLAD
jgi:hypothetical protein